MLWVLTNVTVGNETVVLGTSMWSCWRATLSGYTVPGVGSAPLPPAGAERHHDGALAETYCTNKVAMQALSSALFLR